MRVIVEIALDASDAMQWQVSVHAMPRKGELVQIADAPRGYNGDWLVHQVRHRVTVFDDDWMAKLPIVILEPYL